MVRVPLNFFSNLCPILGMVYFISHVLIMYVATYLHDPRINGSRVIT